MIQHEIKKNQSMIIWLAICPLIDLCPIASLYAERDRYCRHCDFLWFCKLTPSGLKAVLLRLVLIFQKEISTMKLPIKCSQNCFTFTAFRKIDKFYCKRFFFVGYIGSLLEHWLVKKQTMWNTTCRLLSETRTAGFEVIKLECIFKLKIKHNDWLLVGSCPQAANHCALFWVWDCAQIYNIGAWLFWLLYPRICVCIFVCLRWLICGLLLWYFLIIINPRTTQNIQMLPIMIDINCK